MKRMVTLLLSVLLTFTLAIPALAGSLDSEIATASRFLQVKGILQGNASGDLQLEKPLTRAELAVIASRLTVNQEHLMADKSYYSGQCKFTDVPDWARVYVGYCASMYYVKGYSDGSYGPDGLVTPAAACTVLLRCCGNLVPFEWSYETALDAAVQYGIAPREALQEQYISRGNLSILLYRTAEKLGFSMDAGGSETPDTDGRSPLTRNADGSINVPSDGSQYIPQTGDVIRCDDGTNYTITDTRLYGNSMFAEGPLPPLPTQPATGANSRSWSCPKPRYGTLRMNMVTISSFGTCMKPAGCSTPFIMPLEPIRRHGKMASWCFEATVHRWPKYSLPLMTM